jgi:hypothetical protein
MSSIAVWMSGWPGDGTAQVVAAPVAATARMTTAARNDEEIADADRYPSVTTFNGGRLAEERAELELDEFVQRTVPSGGFCLAELSSRNRGGERTSRRVEFAAAAVRRYDFRSATLPGCSTITQTR